MLLLRILRLLELPEDVIKNWNVNRVFMPILEKEERDERVKGWNKAVKYAYGWAKEE